jgi:hypothetical protein
VSAHRRFFRRIDAHFARAISSAEERELRLHLPECATCRLYYERHLLIEKLDPAAEASGAEARIAAGLGLGLDRRRATAHYALAAAVALVLALGLPSLRSRIAQTPPATTGAAPSPPTVPAQPTEESDLAARGVATANASSHLLVYRFRSNHGAELVEQAIGRNDELAFAYANPERFDRVLIFGVDEHRHVYWYHPVWSKQREDPSGVTIAAGPEVHELPEAVRQPLDGHTLHVIALFTREPLSVKTVERMLRTGEMDLSQRVPRSLQIEKVLEVER